MNRHWILGLAALALVAACSGQAVPPDGTVIYTGATIIPVTGEADRAEAVAVKDGLVVGVGTEKALKAASPGAVVDGQFAGKVIVPGFIDPHTHIILGAMLYAMPITPPWPMATADGMADALPNRESFLARLAEIERAAPAGKTLIVYGYHNLVHGDLTRADLDQITRDRPLILQHYSAHDLYLNSKAIEVAGFTPALAEKLHGGVGLDSKGQLTGRMYEAGAFAVLGAFQNDFLAPEKLSSGFDVLTSIVQRSGVTTMADLGYGMFGWPLEDAAIAAEWKSVEDAGYRLYLVADHNALQRKYGEARVQAVQDWVSGKVPTPAPVLPRVKFFADGAYYSQTMRLTPPGYLTGQSQGTAGVWVLKPDEIAPTIEPYWKAGFSAHIHSNGDAAQDASLAALATLRADGSANDFVIEHGGLFSPEQAVRAGQQNASVSAASHYLAYMSGLYQAPLGEPRARWITPLGALSGQGVTVALHSDAPLAPPEPLRAAGAHITRATREGSVYEAQMALTPYDALEAITIDAARVIGLDEEIGSIAPGKRADFAVLESDPLEKPCSEWSQIKVWGVVLNGKPRPAGAAD